MGLDQFAFATKDGEEKGAEIAYWRKHNRLQGWMRELWESKGGKGEFNCTPVELTIEDLDALAIAITDNELPETSGFFFGGDSYEDYDRDNDIAFIDKARKAINNGETVTYDSWW